MGAIYVRMKIHELLNSMGQAIDEWGTKMFPIKLPTWGVIEELGEAVHCVLKRQQKIRDMDKDEHFREHFGDALADMIVYNLHHATMDGIKFNQSDFTSIDDNKTESLDAGHRTDFNIENPGDIQEWISSLTCKASYLLDGIETHTGEEIHLAIIRDCNAAARSAGIKLLPLLEDTWAKVSQRDWKKNPSDAHVKDDPDRVEEALVNEG